MPVNTLWSTDDSLMINPPNWEAAFHFLETFTNLDNEFERIELASTGMFDLDHPETAAKLDIPGAIRSIKLKSRLARDILTWIAENEHLLDEK